MTHPYRLEYIRDACTSSEHRGNRADWIPIAEHMNNVSATDTLLERSETQWDWRAMKVDRSAKPPSPASLTTADDFRIVAAQTKRLRKLSSLDCWTPELLIQRRNRQDNVHLRKRCVMGRVLRRGWRQAGPQSAQRSTPSQRVAGRELPSRGGDWHLPKAE